MVVQITPPAITNIGWRTYIIFAVLNAAFLPVVYMFFPETKGLELEAIDHLFARPEVAERSDTMDVDPDQVDSVFPKNAGEGHKKRLSFWRELEAEVSAVGLSHLSVFKHPF